MTTTRHTHQLPAGETRRLRVRAGTLLVAHVGRVTLWLTPRWLSEHLLRPGLGLSEGECHLVEESGWIELQAGTAGVQLMVEAPEGWSVSDLFRAGARRSHGLRPIL